MPLILAIEPDRRQAAQLRSIAKSRLEVDLVLADSAEHALAALGSRVPDLILTAALLSPKDEAALDVRLRELDALAAHVQTLTIPVLAAAQPKPRGGMLSALRRRARKAAPDGCDPAVFADQCAEYLERARTERAQINAHSELHRVVPDSGAKPTPLDAPALAPEPAPEGGTLEPQLLSAPNEHANDASLAAPKPEVLAGPVATLQEMEEPVEVKVVAQLELAIEVAVSAEVSVSLEARHSGPDFRTAKASLPERLGPASLWPDMHALSIGEPSEAAGDPGSSETGAKAEPASVNELAVAQAALVEPAARKPVAHDTPAFAVDRPSIADAEAYEINVDELFKDLEPVLAAAPRESAPVPEPAPIVDLSKAAAPAPPVEPNEPEEIAALPPDDGLVVELEPAGDTPLSAAGIEIDPALWTPSRLGVSQLWPPIEGGLATARPVAFVDLTPTRPVEEAPAPAMSFSIPVSRQPADPEPPVQPAWLDVVESLRRDVERLQAERAQPPPAPLLPPVPPNLAADKAGTPVSRGADAQPGTGDAGPPPARPEAAAPATKETRGKSRSKRGKRPARKSKAVQDEWGFFDPTQVGFATLLSKLDEITAEGEDQTSSDS